MGDLLQSLGGVFGGGPQPAVNPMDALAGMGGFAGPVGQTESVMGFPGISRGVPPTGSPADVNPTLPQEEAVAVRGWKPKGQTILGAIADAYLQSQGMAPAFKQKRDERNLQEAMEGFTQEPLEAIRRMAQIPGMQEKAWLLYNQVVDNQRADGTLNRQNRALDMRNDDYMYQRVAGMMGAARPDSWSKMRELAIKQGLARGIDVAHLIPEEYDADSLEYIRYGAVKPKDQEVLKERRENNQARVELGRDRLAVTDENADLAREQRGQIAATNEAGRNARYNTPKPKAGGGQAQSILPDGSRIVYGGGDKRSAKTAIVIGADGTKRYLNKLPNGQWKVVAPPSK